MRTTTLEVLDPTGHLTLEWSADDADGVDRARREFSRLAEEGYAFFISGAPDAPRVLQVRDWGRGGRLDVRSAGEVFDREVRRARRTTAVPPLRGG